MRKYPEVIFIHTDTVNITVFRTVQLLWKVNGSVQTSRTGKHPKKPREDKFMYMLQYTETTFRQ